MNKIIKLGLGLLGLSLLVGAHLVTVEAQTGPTLDAWKYETATLIIPRVSSSSVKIPSLATTTANICIAPNASGTLTLVACGSGSGSATTTINGVSGPTFTFTASGPGLSISTSTGTVTFTYSSSTLGLGTASVYAYGDFLSSSTVYIATTSGNWGGTWQTYNFTDVLASSTPVIQSTSTFIAGDMLYYDGSAWQRVVPNTSTSSLRFLSQSGGFSPSWQVIPEAGSYSFYLDNASSTDLPAYRTTGSPTSTIYSITNTISATTTMGAWLTPSSTPNLTHIPAGLWDIHIDATVDTVVGVKSVRYYADVFKYDGSETLLFTTQVSQIITGTNANAPEEIDLEHYASAITLLSTDRIGVRIYASLSGSGGNPSSAIYFQGVTHSRISLPGDTIDATNFVPYSGATALLNMGTFGLTVGATSTLSGNVILGTVTSTLLAVDSTGKIVATTTTSGVTSANSITGAVIFSGTANQITISSSSQTITFATPQDIHTGASPTFAGLNFTNATGSGNLQVLTFKSTGTSTIEGALLDASGNKYSTSTGGGTPAGASLDIQFNNGGAFGADTTGRFKYSSSTYQFKLGTSTDFSADSYDSTSTYKFAVGGNILTGGGTPTTTVYGITASSSTVISYSGATSTWTVPANATGTITIHVIGAAGGTDEGLGGGGYGGAATGTLTLASSSPGTVYYYCVGGKGEDGPVSASNHAAVGGFCGGGNSATGTIRTGGAGGGATWLGTAPTFSTSTATIVAGGGGGSGTQNGGTSVKGGDGGGTSGAAGAGTAPGGGGTQTAGGAAGGGDAEAGTVGQGGDSATSDAVSGGGGGGGLYGGGGGDGGATQASAGGGGSGFVSTNLTTTSTAASTNTGNGQIVITYNIINSPPTVSGNNTASTLTFSNTIASTTLTFANGGFKNTPTCSATPGSYKTVWFTSKSATAVTINASSSFVSGDTLDVICLDK